MENWVKVCSLEEIPAMGSRVVKGPACDIALFRDGGGQVYALRDQCPHRGGPISQGIVSRGRVTCPLHGMNIGLADGKAALPDEGCVETYPVRINEGMIFLALRIGQA